MENIRKMLYDLLEDNEMVDSIIEEIRYLLEYEYGIVVDMDNYDYDNEDIDLDYLFDNEDY